uniref:Uncharacterized protein n=1 Tax=Staphylococcus sp. 693-7 TaxID=678944 RepID=D2JDK4_9STAP|nr:hypothetical protein SAP044A_003 [Staphylococcus sp. 693-7]
MKISSKIIILGKRRGGIMSIYIESVDSFNINEVKNLKIAKKQ